MDTREFGRGAGGAELGRHGGGRRENDRSSREQPSRPERHATDRTIDGTKNNPRNTEWGSTGEPLLRLTTADYADGQSEPAGADRVSPREISNLVFDQTASFLNERGLSDLVWQWGQFLDHDIGEQIRQDEGPGATGGRSMGGGPSIRVDPSAWHPAILWRGLDHGREAAGRQSSAEKPRGWVHEAVFAEFDRLG